MAAGGLRVMINLLALSFNYYWLFYILQLLAQLQ
jgi:hypothetical protein